MVIKNLKGKVIFENDSFSIKKTVEDAIRKGVDLRRVDLKNAFLIDANIKGVDLRGADLSLATLKYADLSFTDLRGANLTDTDLRGANLMGADFRGAKNIPYIPLACPSEGSFIGWKKIYSKSIGYLVKLRIPEDARRCSATTLRCRCDKAEVLAIECLSTRDKDIKKVVNDTYNPACTYTVGEMVYPDSFDEDRWNECSHGIHFFINKQDAIDY